MHELAITSSVVDAVTERTGNAPVAVVRVRVGRLAGVVPDAMRFCFELVTAGTPLEGAVLEIEQPEGRGRCRSCGEEIGARRTDPAVRLRQRGRRGRGRARAGGRVGRARRTHELRWSDMCRTCGCGEADVRVEGRPPSAGTARTTPSAGVVEIETALLAKNDHLAAHNRTWLAERGIVALNLMSSPGSGKTSLLRRTIAELAGVRPIAVIEGDQETRLDAERIRGTGAPVVQINTGAGCHLDADMLARGPGRTPARARIAGLHRERRQPRLPGPVRPGGGRPGGRRVGHRGRGQAAEVPDTCSRPPTSS